MTSGLSPKEATEMSRDIKYIGMDVHKEAIVIAVLNSGRRWSWSPSHLHRRNPSALEQVPQLEHVIRLACQTRHCPLYHLRRQFCVRIFRQPWHEQATRHGSSSFRKSSRLLQVFVFV